MNNSTSTTINKGVYKSNNYKEMENINRIEILKKRIKIFELNKKESIEDLKYESDVKELDLLRKENFYSLIGKELKLNYDITLFEKLPSWIYKDGRRYTFYFCMAWLKKTPFEMYYRDTIFKNNLIIVRGETIDETINLLSDRVKSLKTK